MSKNNMGSLESTLYRHYLDLLDLYGHPEKYWPQWCSNEKSVEDREKVILGTILTQRTTWHNAQIALKKLKEAGLLSLDGIAGIVNATDLLTHIRPAGFHTTKPYTLKNVSKFFKEKGGVTEVMKMDMHEIRRGLLNTKGVGKETADTILLYGLDKPSFVIDEYTFRWVENLVTGYEVGTLEFVVENEELLSVIKKRNYDRLHQLFGSSLEPEIELYRNFHALIIVSQRGVDKSGMEII